MKKGIQFLPTRKSFMKKQEFMNKEYHFGAHHYAPLPIVLHKAKGAYLFDTDGKQYIDMMSAYSAVSLGHSNPKIIKTLVKQAKKLGVTSRACFNDKLPLFLEQLCYHSGMDRAVPMNSGAEAVETAIKIARKWGEQVKKIKADCVEIIACSNNFHGRTLGVISFSTEPQYKIGFGPFLPGVKHVPFNNTDALEKAITKNTAAFLVEPIQGEAGIIVPSKEYLDEVFSICQKNNVLLIVDEIQTGLARTGKLFCFQYNDIKPDMIIVGKALGGGIYPVSAVIGRIDVMDVLTPGDHGSTFGGNPLASAIGLKSLEMLTDTDLISHVQKLGIKSLKYLKNQLVDCSIVKEIRGKGLFIGIEFVKGIKAKPIVLELIEKGILSKDTHENVIRIAPPLIIEEKQMIQALKIMVNTIKNYQK